MTLIRIFFFNRFKQKKTPVNGVLQLFANEFPLWNIEVQAMNNDEQATSFHFQITDSFCTPT